MTLRLLGRSLRLDDDQVPQQLRRADRAKLDTHGFARREPREQEEAIGALAGDPLEARLPAGPGIRGLATLERGSHAGDHTSLESPSRR